MRFLFAKLLIICLLMGGVVVFALADGQMRVGMAQERLQVAQAEEKKGLFDVLFGRNKSAKEKRKAAKPKPKKRVSSPSIINVAPAPQLVDKAPDAKRILVIGDSLASDFAKALDRFYIEDANWVVVGAGVGSSGIVRDDYFDWNGAVKDFILKNEFDLAVVAVGINDRQTIAAVDGRHKALTDGWQKEYDRRVDVILQDFQSAGKPVFWLGLPPMRKASYGKAMQQISSLHRLSVFENGGEFVDIYERFLNDDGEYSKYGPDLNGKVVTMRKADGIHLSGAGNEKAAFFVDRAIKKVFRDDISIELALSQNNETGVPLQSVEEKTGKGGDIIDMNAPTEKGNELIVALDDAQITPLPLEDIFNPPTNRTEINSAE